MGNFAEILVDRARELRDFREPVQLPQTLPAWHWSRERCTAQRLEVDAGEPCLVITGPASSKQQGRLTRDERIG
jgi:hypothetical protein